MPNIKRRSQEINYGTTVYRLYDTETKSWYAKLSPFTWRKWTEHESLGRVYKRKGDVMLSLNHMNLPLSEDRFVIVEYELVRTNRDDPLVISESHWERFHREKHEQQERNGSQSKVPRFGIRS